MNRFILAVFAFSFGYVANAASISWNAYQYKSGTVEDFGYFVDKSGNPYTTTPSGINIVLCLMNAGTVSEVVQTGDNNGSGYISGIYTWVYGEKHSVGDTFKVMLQDTTGGDPVYRELAAAANDEGNDPTTFSSLTLDSSYTELGDMWSNSLVFATGNYQDVPEPTSGLMLALGLVALGLKRKQKKA